MISRPRAPERLRETVLWRPILFILGGLAVGLALLGLDAVVGEAVPGALRFPVTTSRLLLITLAGATLTLAGITFWVRAASVQLAASQYSPRVVHGFLQDWFQQSMMGLLVGFFACIVVILRVIPDPTAGDAVGALPHLSILVSLCLAAGSVLVVLVAIRNSVRSMQAGELARRITDGTTDAIRRTYRHGVTGSAGSLRRAHETPPGRGRPVRADASGWVHRVDEAELLSAVPEGATVRLDVRPGLFVAKGRPLATIWSDAAPAATADRRVAEAVRLARTRGSSGEVQEGVQQLVDVALGSLTHAADTASAYEVIVHIELLMRELMVRDLPPSASEGEGGRWILRPRAYTFGDYVGEAYDRLRLAVAPHPTVVVGLLESLGGVVRDLEDLHGAGQAPAGSPLAQRAEAFRRQARMLLEASRTQDHVAQDLALIDEVAVRHGLVSAGGRG
jgi:uncharacterized membrane protein